MKQIKLFILTLAVALYSATFAYSNDETLAKRVFKLENFSSVSVSSGIDLYLQPSNKTEATLITSKELLDNVVVELDGSDLNIRLKNSFSWTNKKRNSIKVYLSYKQLNDISASSGAHVYMQNNATLKSDKLSLSGSSGAGINLKIEAKDLSCNASSGSNLNLKGRADAASFSTSSGSNVMAKELTVKECSVKASGGSNTSITTTETINAQASSGSHVYYWGDPQKKSISAHSASEVKAQK